jgi:protein subunit release factor A
MKSLTFALDFIQFIVKLKKLLKEMKKLSILLVALVAVFAVSCTKESDKVLNLINTTIDQLKKVTDQAGYEKAQTDFATAFEKLSNEVDDSKFTEEEKATIEKAMDELNKVGEEMAAKFAPEEEPAAEGEETAPAEGEETAPAAEPAAEPEAAPAEGEPAAAEAK